MATAPAPSPAPAPAPTPASNVPEGGWPMGAGSAPETKQPDPLDHLKDK